MSNWDARATVASIKGVYSSLKQERDERMGDIYEQDTERMRERFGRVLDMRHVSALSEFLRAMRHRTLTVFERLRKMWP